LEKGKKGGEERKESKKDEGTSDVDLTSQVTNGKKKKKGT